MKKCKDDSNHVLSLGQYVVWLMPQVEVSDFLELATKEFLLVLRFLVHPSSPISSYPVASGSGLIHNLDLSSTLQLFVVSLMALPCRRWVCYLPYILRQASGQLPHSEKVGRLLWILCESRNE